MTSPLVNCIVNYAAVNATLSVHDECYFNSLMLNDKLATGWHPTSCSRPERSGLFNGYRSRPMEEVLPRRKIVQCRMSSVQGAVNTSECVGS